MLLRLLGALAGFWSWDRLFAGSPFAEVDDLLLGSSDGAHR
jgi:hypothetical protein